MRTWNQFLKGIVSNFITNYLDNKSSVQSRDSSVDFSMKPQTSKNKKSPKKVSKNAVPVYKSKKK